MLSEATTAVVTPSILMTTPAAVAERDGVSKQAVTKKVREYAEKGLLTVERDAQQRIVRFNIAEYDHARGKVGDPSKDQRRPAPEVPASPGVDKSESYDEALRQRTWTEAERSRIRLAEEKGNLVRKDRILDAVSNAAEAIVRSVDSLPSEADDLVLAIEKDGVHGARVALKRLAARVRRSIADALAEVAAGAPVFEPEDDETPE